MAEPYSFMLFALCTGTLSSWNWFGSFTYRLDSAVYKDIVNICVLSTFWLQIRECQSHVAMIFSCPHTVHLAILCIFSFN